MVLRFCSWKAKIRFSYFKKGSNFHVLLLFIPKPLCDLNWLNDWELWFIQKEIQESALHSTLFSDINKISIRLRAAFLLSSAVLGKYISGAVTPAVRGLEEGKKKRNRVESRQAALRGWTKHWITSTNKHQWIWCLSYQSVRPVINPLFTATVPSCHHSRSRGPSLWW